MVKDIQRAGNIKLQCCRDTGSFGFGLLQKLVVQITQDRHFLRVWGGKERTVHIPYGAVNDGLFHGLQALLAADNKFTQGEDKIGLQGKRAVVLGIVEVYVHRVHILGLSVNAPACRGQPDNLTVQTLHKGKILGFRVADNNIVVGNEKGICHFPFCRKGFTTARCSQDKPVWIFKLLAVAEYHVVRKCVQSVVQGCACLKKLLRDEWDKNSGA